MKKVCIKGNEFNTNYHEVYGEEKAIADGYLIFDVPQGCEDCAFEDFDNNGFNVELYNDRKEKEQNQFKISELKSWFENYFDKQLNQSLWQSDFVPSHDNYFHKDYNNLEELKTQAEFVRQEIKRLEK